MTRRKTECSCSRVRHEHGSEAMYTRDGCRCLPCAMARHRYVHALAAGEPVEARTVPITATRLRLRALTLLGYSPPELAALTGMHEQAVRRLRSGENGNPRYQDDATVLRQTDQVIADVFDRLWCTPSTGPKAARMRALASRAGWLPPLAIDDVMHDIDKDYVYSNPQLFYDDVNPAGTGEMAPIIDEIAVEEAIAGRKVRLTKLELSAAVRKMTDMGYSAELIGERLGTSSRQVQRYRNGVAA